MTRQASAPANPSGRVIETLVEGAKRTGEPDRYAGKRAWMRFKAAERLEVTAAVNDPLSYASATMHNVSRGGCAFWSKRSFEGGTIIYVRQFLPDGSAAWLRARVRHCTAGLRGYLTGVSFDLPEIEAPGMPLALRSSPVNPRIRAARRVR